MEEEFIERIRAHEGILRKICDIYFYRHPYREDCYQEMLIRLWRAYPAFKGQCAFATWMYRVALNTAIDLVRRESVRPLHRELTAAEYALRDASGGNAEAELRKERLYRAIDTLTEVDKAIILLYLEENDYKQIAEVVGLSVNHVGVKINRIKKQLIKLLKDGDE